MGGLCRTERRGNPQYSRASPASQAAGTARSRARAPRRPRQATVDGGPSAAQGPRVDVDPLRSQGAHDHPLLGPEAQRGRRSGSHRQSTVRSPRLERRPPPGRGSRASGRRGSRRPAPGSRSAPSADQSSVAVTRPARQPWRAASAQRRPAERRSEQEQRQQVVAQRLQRDLRSRRRGRRPGSRPARRGSRNQRKSPYRDSAARTASPAPHAAARQRAGDERRDHAPSPAPTRPDRGCALSDPGADAGDRSTSPGAPPTRSGRWLDVSISTRDGQPGRIDAQLGADGRGSRCRDRRTRATVPGPNIAPNGRTASIGGASGHHRHSRERPALKCRPASHSHAADAHVEERAARRCSSTAARGAPKATASAAAEDPRPARTTHSSSA